MGERREVDLIPIVHNSLSATLNSVYRFFQTERSTVYFVSLLHSFLITRVASGVNLELTSANKAKVQSCIFFGLNKSSSHSCFLWNSCSIFHSVLSLSSNHFRIYHSSEAWLYLILLGTPSLPLFILWYRFSLDALLGLFGAYEFHDPFLYFNEFRAFYFQG